MRKAFSKAICSKFGRPDLPSEEELTNFITQENIKTYKKRGVFLLESELAKAIIKAGWRRI